MPDLRRILLIEDDPDIAELLQRKLRKGFGAEVDVCTDGAHGLARARTAAYDLILCDLVLPGMDGLEVARQLKQPPEAVGAPLLFLTASMASAFRDRPPSAYGAVGAISKPVDLRTLCGLIREQLEAAGV